MYIVSFKEYFPRQNLIIKKQIIINLMGNNNCSDRSTEEDEWRQSSVLPPPQHWCALIRLRGRLAKKWSQEQRGGTALAQMPSKICPLVFGEASSFLPPVTSHPQDTKGLLPLPLHHPTGLDRAVGGFCRHCSVIIVLVANCSCMEKRGGHRNSLT